MKKYYLSVDIGGMTIKAGIVREDGTILRKRAVDTEAQSRSQEEIMEATADLLEALLQEEGMSRDDIAAIGIGAPGTPDNRRGLLIFAGNLPFRNCPVREIIGRRMSLPVYLGNDANVAALAESRIGAGKGCQTSITVTLGTGIGGGVIIDDRVFAGFNGAGCELGHTVIVKGGLPCGCGRDGCMEVYCAAPALIRQTREAAEANPESLLAAMIREDDGHVGGRTVFAAEARGDACAARAAEVYIDYLAEGIANFVNSYFPQAVILGGGVSHQGETLRARVEAGVRKRVFVSGDLPQTAILLASLGNDAGIVGAALFASDCLADGLDG